MSAIICGYEVPKKFPGEGWTSWYYICDLVIHDYNYCRKDVQNYLKIKNAKYVLKELPNQHGRLIDADRLYDLIEDKYKYTTGNERALYRYFLDLICDSNTIIEADK